MSEPIENIDDAIRFLDGLINRERHSDSVRARERMSLAPIQNLLEAVGHPEHDLSIVHVAGSKGKGSTCLFGEALSRELGERTGVFLSPHLERWTERFRIDGEEVDGAVLAEAVERLRPHVERLREQCPDEAPSFFDATTAVALMLFSDAGVDRVWLEVGLGGRLDSTNAVHPAVTCITSIELEHTQVLGDTLEQIASEKAGILKAGVPAVVARLDPEAAKAVGVRAEAADALLRVEGESFELGTQGASSSVAPSALRYRDSELEFTIELQTAGEQLARSAGLAIACVRALGTHPPQEVEAAARLSLPKTRLPGRIELIPGEPRVVIDSAHTEASARALAAALVDLDIGAAQLVLSVSEGKSLRAIVDALAPKAACVFVTLADRDRSLPEFAISEMIRERAPQLHVEIEPDPRRAVRAALAAARSDNAVVVAGSTYLAGFARGVLRETGRLSE